ncbi:MAG TPA: type 1 glutamine amidotransferase domain-containing protein [Candidatus Deferrimicrobium sp.]|nr:type 1 glutamine amidotransferase domain-containing protein [Candidatus Deferrimicrobium sp.]
MDVNGKKVLIISADKFEDSELEYPVVQLKNKGAIITIAGPTKEPFYGKARTKVVPDITFDELTADYNILILPGGKAPATIRKNEHVLEIVRQFNEQGTLIAAICHGPQILISAGIMKGRIATSYFQVAKELQAAGATYLDEPVVIHKNLITSRKPADLSLFIKAIFDYES